MNIFFRILGIVLVIALAILAVSIAMTGLFGPTIGALTLLFLSSTALLAGAFLLVFRPWVRRVG